MPYSELKKGTFSEYKLPEVKDNVDVLPAGFYRPVAVDSMFGTQYFYHTIKESEKLIKVLSDSFKEIINNIPKFFDEHARNIHKSMGFTHKLGVLIHGRAGTGKTKAIEILIRALVKEYHAICLDITGMAPHVFIPFIHRIRETNPNSMIVLFQDDVENLMRNWEDDYLAFLDGGQSVNNLLYIASTNYIEKITERIKDRPSRIKFNIHHDGIPLEGYEQFIYDKMKPLEGMVPNLKHVAYEMAEACFERKLTMDETKHGIIDYILNKEVPEPEKPKEDVNNGFAGHKGLAFGDKPFIVLGGYSSSNIFDPSDEEPKNPDSDDSE